MGLADSYAACADVNLENYACERPKGHLGPHMAFIDDDVRETIEWDREDTP